MNITYAFLLLMSVSTTDSVIAMEATKAKTKCWELIDDATKGAIFIMVTKCRYNLKMDLEGRLFAVNAQDQKSSPKHKILTRTSNSGSGISIIDLGPEELVVQLKAGMNQLKCGDSILVNLETITYYDRSIDTLITHNLGEMPVPLTTEGLLS